MNRPVITIGNTRYRLTQTPMGENCCALCDLFNFCWSTSGEMPCLEFKSERDWHFEKVKEATT